MISSLLLSFEIRYLKNNFWLLPSPLQKTTDPEDTNPEIGSGHVTPHPSDVLDMPVDPNEPTYCLCHQVSYGEMIGCDNQDVRFYFRRIFCHFFHTNTKFLPFRSSAPSSGSTLRVWDSQQSPRASGFVQSARWTGKRTSSEFQSNATGIIKKTRILLLVHLFINILYHSFSYFTSF